MDFSTLMIMVIVFISGVGLGFVVGLKSRDVAQMDETQYRLCVSCIVAKYGTHKGVELVDALNGYMADVKRDLHSLPVELEAIVREVTNVWKQ